MGETGERRLLSHVSFFLNASAWARSDSVGVVSTHSIGREEERARKRTELSSRFRFPFRFTMRVLPGVEGVDQPSTAVDVSCMFSYPPSPPLLPFFGYVRSKKERIRPYA